MELAVFLPGLREQVIDRRADQDLEITGIGNCIPSDRCDAGNQLLAPMNGGGYGDGCAHVLAHHSNIRWNPATGHFHACQDLYQLFFTARGIFGGDDRDLCLGAVRGLPER